MDDWPKCEYCDGTGVDNHNCGRCNVCGGTGEAEYLEADEALEYLAPHIISIVIHPIFVEGDKYAWGVYFPSSNYELDKKFPENDTNIYKTVTAALNAAARAVRERKEGK